MTCLIVHRKNIVDTLQKSKIRANEKIYMTFSFSVTHTKKIKIDKKKLFFCSRDEKQFNFTIQVLTNSDKKPLKHIIIKYTMALCVEEAEEMRDMM